MVSRDNGPRRTLGVLAVLAILAFALPVTAATTIVVGMVKDVNGNPVEGASVTITEASSGRKFELKTGKAGAFTQVDLHVGAHHIVVSKEGVGRFEGNLDVRLGRVTVTFELM